FGAAGPARVDGYDPAAVPHAAQKVMKEDRVGLARVRAPEQDQLGFLSLAIRRRSSPGSEHCRQTDDAWGVSSPIAAVDVVAAHGPPRELLGHEVQRVGGLRAAEPADRVWPDGARARESVGRAGKRFLPRRGTEAAIFPNQRLGQADAAFLHGAFKYSPRSQPAPLHRTVYPVPLFRGKP